jgi:DNA-binding Xre family transcriptional regulator
MDSRKPRSGDDSAGVGAVVCRLDAVLLAAQRHYQVDLDVLAKVTQIDRRVLSALVKDQKEQFDASVFARLCWVFDVPLGALLEYLSPQQLERERASAPSPVQITLPAVSLRSELPTDYGAVRCLLRQVLDCRQQEWLSRLGKPGKRHVSYPDLESLLGIKAQRLADWANNVPTRYDRVKMAELCHALRLGVGDLWVYDPAELAGPLPASSGGAHT